MDAVLEVDASRVRSTDDADRAIYAFDHQHAESPRFLKELLGGKGAGLAEMTSVLNMPVPPGFTVAVPVCRAYRTGGWPDGLTEGLNAHLTQLELRLGRRFGDPTNPLLLAVRSGAAFSMPGMMDTVLNLGLNPQTVQGLAAATGDDEFARDTYRRFLLTYTKTVLELEVDEPTGSGSSRDRVERLQAALDAAGVVVPSDPREQLRAAVEAVFRSWDSPRAKAYRTREGIDQNLGTAVNVQAMVFGNYGDNSGTGVVFTGNPNTGEAGMYGDFLPRAQGEDVVAGIARTLDIGALGECIPGADAELAGHLAGLEKHYRDMCDVEFTIESGTVWILQTRVAKRGAVAAVRAAVRMVEDPRIALTCAEAVARVPLEVRAAARAEIAAAAATDTRADCAVAKGLGASPGRVSGRAVFSADAAADAVEADHEPVILVRRETSPEDVHGMGVSVGILTSHGGLVSHAAVVARGWGIPAVVGAEDLTVNDDDARGPDGEVLFRAGEVITIDGRTGEVWLGQSADTASGDALDPAEAFARDLPELAVLEDWARLPEVLVRARAQVLEAGIGLDEAGTLAVLQLADEFVPDALALAHEVRMRWCGPEVEVEGIVSLKTGGCAEDCHFCSQSGQFTSPVRSVWLDIPALVEAAKQTAATGATEFCIVAAVRGPDERLMNQMREGVAAIKAAVDIQVAASLGMLTKAQVDDLAAMGVHRYNHNLETARSYFTRVVTTHTWEERWDTLAMVRAAGMEVCCGGIVGMGETLEQRAEFAAQLAGLSPDEVPLNFLNPRPGTPFGDVEQMPAVDALRTIAAFRLALPRTILRFAGGREITLGDLGTRDGLLGGINAVIVGNYLTTLGRDPAEDLALLNELSMPIKALSDSI